MKRAAASLAMVSVLAFVMLLAHASMVLAHGGLEQSNPAADARLKKAPGKASMTFSEVPSKDSVVKLSDGCKRDVVETTSVAGNDLVAILSAGQPGEWKASYRVISAEDGHLTKGSYSFTVAGAKDCTPDKNGDGGGDGSPEPPDDPSGAADDGDGDGSSFPVIPVAVGAAGLLIVGLVARRASGA